MIKSKLVSLIMMMSFFFSKKSMKNEWKWKNVRFKCAQQTHCSQHKLTVKSKLKCDWNEQSYYELNQARSCFLVWRISYHHVCDWNTNTNTYTSQSIWTWTTTTWTNHVIVTIECLNRNTKTIVRINISYY